MLKESVGDRLRRARKVKGLSQEGLADLSGVNRSYIGDLEANAERRPCEPDNLRALAKCLNVPLRFLAEPLGWYDDEIEMVSDWQLAILQDTRLEDSKKSALIEIIKGLLPPES